jgi:hypothetical protein
MKISFKNYIWGIYGSLVALFVFTIRKMLDTKNVAKYRQDSPTVFRQKSNGEQPVF